MRNTMQIEKRSYIKQDKYDIQYMSAAKHVRTNRV